MSAAFLAVLVAAAVAAGALGAVTGVGIGSALVPLVALRTDLKLAVAIVAAPHLVGGLVRAVQLWRRIDRRAFVRFGIVCAVASIAGALVHTRIDTRFVAYVFAGLLVLAGIVAALGVAERVKLGTRGAWVTGALSGFFGGFAGEQGGLRAVGLLGFDLDKEAFVATSTAVGVVVDAARLPVYLASEWPLIVTRTGVVAIVVTTAGVLVGTLGGGVLLKQIPERAFHRVLGGALVLIGVLLLAH